MSLFTALLRTFCCVPLHSPYVHTLCPPHPSVMSRRPRSPSLADSNPAVGKRSHTLKSEPHPDLNVDIHPYPHPTSTASKTDTNVTPTATPTSTSTSTPSATHSATPTAAPSVTTTTGAAATPPWCQCGWCAVDDEKKHERDLCCMEVVPVGLYRRQGGPVCKLDEYTSIIRAGLDDEQFNVCKKIIEKKGVLSRCTFDSCSPVQKRYLLYTCIFQKLKNVDGWTEGVAEQVTRGNPQKLMPACLARAIRQQWH